MEQLHVGMAGVDITPRFHPEFGAWGTSPTVTELDMPLLARCVALKQAGRLVVWYGTDLAALYVAQANVVRDELAMALGLVRDHVVWSSGQSHSGGVAALEADGQDAKFTDAERKRVMGLLIDVGRQAVEQLQPANVFAGKGYCDSMSYNTRFPMPTGGVKFSRHHAEGLQSGKYYDPVIGLVRFDDKQGKPLGVIFNFCAHPATMIGDKYISPDWVGTARQYVEEAVGGAPALFAQGFVRL